MKIREKKRLFVLVVLLVSPLMLAGYCRPWGRDHVQPEQVWQRAEALGKRHDLPPELIYAIAFAESSFNANASNGKARGLMQMTPPAWDRVSKRPFHHAWDWKQNMTAATQYLALLRDELVSANAYSVPVLAAAYRYGPTKVAKLNYELSALPPASNRVYRAIFSGQAPELPPVPGIDPAQAIATSAEPRPAPMEPTLGAPPNQAEEPARPAQEAGEAPLPSG